MTDKAYYFDHAEFAMLAGKSGMQTLFGFADNNLSGTDEKTFVLSMNSLVRNGLLSIGTDALIMGDGIRALFDSVQNAETALVLYPMNRVKGVKCCYIGKNVVVSELASGWNDKIRVRIMDGFDFKTYLNEAGFYIPTSQIIEYDIAEDNGVSDNIIRTELLDFIISSGFNIKADELRVLDGIVWVIDQLDTKTGDLLTRYCLIDDLTCYFLVTLKPNASDIIAYSVSMLNRLIDSCLNTKGEQDV